MKKIDNKTLQIMRYTKSFNKSAYLKLWLFTVTLTYKFCSYGKFLSEAHGVYGEGLVPLGRVFRAWGNQQWYLKDHLVWTAFRDKLLLLLLL